MRRIAWTPELRKEYCELIDNLSIYFPEIVNDDIYAFGEKLKILILDRGSKELKELLYE